MSGPIITFFDYIMLNKNESKTDSSGERKNKSMLVVDGEDNLIGFKKIKTHFEVKTDKKLLRS
jgi:hypothetical protein